MSNKKARNMTAMRKKYPNFDDVYYPSQHVEILNNRAQVVNLGQVKKVGKSRIKVVRPVQVTPTETKELVGTFKPFYLRPYIPQDNEQKPIQEVTGVKSDAKAKVKKTTTRKAVVSKSDKPASGKAKAGTGAEAATKKTGTGSKKPVSKKPSEKG